MQTTAQETQAPTLARAIYEKRHEYIFLVCFLEAEKNASALERQIFGIYKRNNHRDTDYTKALWGGFWALKEKAREHARQVTYSGLLPFAFHSTTVLQGCAA